MPPLAEHDRGEDPQQAALKQEGEEEWGEGEAKKLCVGVSLPITAADGLDDADQFGVRQLIKRRVDRQVAEDPEVEVRDLGQDQVQHHDEATR